MIKIEESMGDIKLCKFIVLVCPKIKGVAERNYVEEMGGYLFSTTFTYNVYMKSVDEDYILHWELYNTLPKKITKEKTDRIFGGVTFALGKNEKMTRVLQFYIDESAIDEYKNIIEFMKQALKPFGYTEVVFSEETYGVIEE